MQEGRSSSSRKYTGLNDQLKTALHETETIRFLFLHSYEEKALIKNSPFQLLTVPAACYPFLCFLFHQHYLKRKIQLIKGVSRLSARSS